MTERKYLPTVAELIDRLAIVTLKSCKIPENKEKYEEEAHLIMEDLDNLGQNGQKVRAILMIGITNNEIWMNESQAREGGSEQDHLLKYTHSINGVRNQAKNVISNITGDRVDLKLDCIAANICKERGYNWEVQWEK